MSGIEGSPSNFRSCPFTWTLTIGSSSQRTPGAHIYLLQHGTAADRGLQREKADHSRSDTLSVRTAFLTCARRARPGASPSYRRFKEQISGTNEQIPGQGSLRGAREGKRNSSCPVLCGRVPGMTGLVRWHQMARLAIWSAM